MTDPKTCLAFAIAFFMSTIFDAYGYAFAGIMIIGAVYHWVNPILKTRQQSRNSKRKFKVNT